MHEAVVLAVAIGVGRAETAMEARVSVSFVSTPFLKCLQVLKEKAGVTFAVEDELPPGALRRPVTLSLGEVTARRALEALLKEVGAGYAVKGSVVLVTSPEAARYESLVFRRYDVRDLWEPIEDFPGPGGPMMPPRACCGQVIISTELEEEQLIVSSIAEMIRARVQPDSWDGELGSSIAARGDVLQIWQKPEAQAEIEKLLAELASRVKRMVEVEVFLLRLDASPERPLARLVDDEATAGLLQASEVIARARTICFVKERQQAFAGEMARYVDAMEKCGDHLDPIVRSLCYGVSFKVRPVCAEGSNAIILEIKVHWAHLNAFREKEVGKGELGVVKVQEADVRRKTLHTTVCVRPGVWAAIELAGERGVAALVRAAPVETR